MDALAEFVREQAAHPYDWSDANCGLWVADWVWQETGSDPFAPWRKFAARPSNARRLSRRLPRLVERVARRAGLAFTRAPRHGDIAVIRIGVHALCAIRSGDFWIMRLENGIATVRATGRIPVFGAWRVR